MADLSRRDRVSQGLSLGSAKGWAFAFALGVQMCLVNVLFARSESFMNHHGMLPDGRPAMAPLAWVTGVGGMLAPLAGYLTYVLVGRRWDLRWAVL